MTEAMPFPQKYDITFLRPSPISPGVFLFMSVLRRFRRAWGEARVRGGGAAF